MSCEPLNGTETISSFCLLNWEHTQAHSSLCYLFNVEGKEIVTYTSTCFSKSFLTKQGNQKEMNQCSLHSTTVWRQKKNQYSKKINLRSFLELYLNENIYGFFSTMAENESRVILSDLELLVPLQQAVLRPSNLQHNYSSQLVVFW